MSNLSDFFDAVKEADVSALKVTGSLIGVVADVAGAISGAGGFLQFFLSVLQPADDHVMKALAQLQTAMEAGIAQIETQIAAEGMLAKKRDLDSGIAAAAAVFGSLPTIVPRLPSLTEGDILEYITTTFQATQFFTDYPDKWQATWLSAPKYKDNWSGTLAPPQTQFVFNYTAVVPYFLRAIYMHLTVVAALQPSALSGSFDQLNKSAAQLQSVHDTILTSGLVPTRLPGQDDVARINFSGPLDSWQAYWFDGTLARGQSVGDGDPRLWPFGAVEIFSGASIVDSYWPYLPHRFDPGSAKPYPDIFFRLIQLRMKIAEKSSMCGSVCR